MLPALVIGLGGTGSAAAVHLKARLATEQRWQDLLRDPSAAERSGRPYDWPILLRALDVDRRNRPRVDGTALDQDVEDLYLNGAIGGIIDKIRQGREVGEAFYPTVVPWFGPDDAAQIRNDDATKFLAEGAGQIRSFGRLSFYADVLGSNSVTKRLEDALDELTKANAVTPNIYIVTSTAGGTGAGILLDVLAYLQKLRDDHDAEFSVTLFCVLSGAFRRRLEGTQRERSEANGYALLRELDRLMNVGREHPAEFTWSRRNRHRMISAPVQYTYFIDGRRGQAAERRLEGFGPETVSPVAVADAIYAHLLPVVGNAFGGYRVNARQYRQGATDLYSTFGVYLIEYGWEPVIRGLTNRAALAALRELPERPAAIGPEVDQFLAGNQDIPEAPGLLPPPVLKELDSEPAREGLLTPAAAWLQAPGDGPPFPDLPALRQPFEDITGFRTDHRGQLVIDTSKDAVRKFWGARGVPLTLKTNQQWHPVADHHESEIDRQWAVVLRGAVARVMSRRDGGPRGGLAFLDRVRDRLDVFRTRVEGAYRPDPAQAKAGRDSAEERVREDRGLFKGRQQLAYLDAEQALLLAEFQQDCHDRTLRMLDRMAQEVEAVRAEADGWRVTVDDATRALEKAVEDVRKERRDAERFPLRHVLPQVDDQATEDWLYQRSLTAAAGRGGPAAALAWQVATAGARPALRLTGGSAAAPVEQMTTALRDRARPLFAPLRELSVFELLERSGATAEAVGKELIAGSDWLVDYDEEEHRRLADAAGEEDGQNNQKRYVFAALPAAGAPGAPLSRDLWTYLRQQRIELNDIVPRNETEERPATDKIMLFASWDSRRLGAFDGFNHLRRSYEQRRTTPPSPHVIAEEKNAALLEATSEDLVSAGVLAAPLPRLSRDDLLLCRDLDLLTAAALALANERLLPRYAPDGTDQMLGWQTRLQRGQNVQELGDEVRLGRLLKSLVLSEMKIDEVRRKAVLAAADEAVRELDWEYGTKRFYRMPPAYGSRTEESLWPLLTVAAYAFIDKQQ